MPVIDRGPFEMGHAYGRWRYEAPPTFPRGWFFDRPSKTIEKPFPNFENPHLTAEQNEENRQWGVRVQEILAESRERQQAREAALNDETGEPRSGDATQVNGLLTPRSTSPVRRTDEQVRQRAQRGQHHYHGDRVRQQMERGPELVRQLCAVAAKSMEKKEQLEAQTYYKTKYLSPNIAKLAYEATLPTDDSFIPLKTSLNGGTLGNSGWIAHRQQSMTANVAASFPHQAFKNAKDNSSPLSRQYTPKSFWPPPPKLQNTTDYTSHNATLDAEFREIFEVPSTTKNDDKSKVNVGTPATKASPQPICATANTITSTTEPDVSMHITTNHSRKRKADPEEMEDDRKTIKMRRLNNEEDGMGYNFTGNGQGIGLGIRGCWA